MRACVIHAAEDLRIEEQADPATTDRTVKIRIRAGGICGSDLHYYWEGRNGDFVIREPLVPGHEVSGEVVEVGAQVTRVRVGDRVALNPGRTCGRCRPCREGRGNLCRQVFFMGSASKFPHMQGGFAEFVVAEEGQCFPVPADLPFTTAAFAEPLSVALHAVARAGSVAGRNILVTGAGPIGLLILLAARRAGVSRSAMTDVLDAPLAAASKLGADHAINVAASPGALAETAALYDGFDVAFEASGNPAGLASCLQAVRPGGIIIQVGTLPAGAFPVAANLVMGKELDLRGAFRFGEVFGDAVDCLVRGTIDVAPLLTAHMPFGQADEAFRLAKDRRESLKVQLAF
jgi:L-idonate 5-dehydrogenase